MWLFCPFRPQERACLVWSPADVYNSVHGRADPAAAMILSANRDFPFINVTVYIRSFAHRRQERFCDPLIRKEELFKAPGKPRVEQLCKILTIPLCAKSGKPEMLWWIEKRTGHPKITP